MKNVEHILERKQCMEDQVGGRERLIRSEDSCEAFAKLGNGHQLRKEKESITFSKNSMSDCPSESRNAEEEAAREEKAGSSILCKPIQVYGVLEQLTMTQTEKYHCPHQIPALESETPFYLSDFTFEDI